MEIEIVRGYEVLPDNNVRFGIRITNSTDTVITDVQVLLDYNESLFQLQEEKVQKLDSIPPTVPRTAKFLLKPLGCVHKEFVEATITYRDYMWKKHIITMRPKEIHCVCPFLYAKPMNITDFMTISFSGHSIEAGLNFEGMVANQILLFLMQTCRNRLYKVEEHFVDDGKILYFSSEAVGEKTHYLLTVFIKPYGDLTQIMLRAASDKPHGLQGFLNEIVSELRHFAKTVDSAREIGIIKNEQVINIIDSVVQRSNIHTGNSAHSVNIRDSVVQRSELDLAQTTRTDDSSNNLGEVQKDTYAANNSEQYHKSLVEQDIARMYDAYLKETKSKQHGIKRDAPANATSYPQRMAPSRRETRTFRGITPPPRKEERIITERRSSKKRLLIPMLFIAILAVTAGYLSDNTIVGGEIVDMHINPGTNSNAAELVVTNFLNAVNEGEVGIAFNMYRGKDFLAPASISMIFSKKGIDPGSITQIDVVSKEFAGDYGFMEVACTVSSLDVIGKEKSSSVIPIYFRLQNSELGWLITGVSFVDQFKIESETVYTEDTYAQSTGKQATQEVSSNLMVKNIEGVRAKNSATSMSNTIDLLKLKVGLNVGSAPVDIGHVVISITDGKTANTLVYAGNQRSYASAGNSDGEMDSFSSSASNNLRTLMTGSTMIGGTTFSNSDHYYTVEKIRDEDASFTQDNPAMNTGDLIIVYIATTSDAAASAGYSYVGTTGTSAGLRSSSLNLVPRTVVNIVLTPESGAATTADFVTPSSYGVKETVQLYP